MINSKLSDWGTLISNERIHYCLITALQVHEAVIKYFRCVIYLCVSYELLMTGSIKTAVWIVIISPCCPDRNITWLILKFNRFLNCTITEYMSSISISLSRMVVALGMQHVFVQYFYKTIYCSFMRLCPLPCAVCPCPNPWPMLSILSRCNAWSRAGLRLVHKSAS